MTQLPISSSQSPISPYNLILLALIGRFQIHILSVLTNGKVNGRTGRQLGRKKLYFLPLLPNGDCAEKKKVERNGRVGIYLPTFSRFSSNHYLNTYSTYCVYSYFTFFLRFTFSVSLRKEKILMFIASLSMSYFISI